MNNKDLFKITVISAVVSSLISVIFGLVIFNNQPNQILSGNGTRFPNGLSTDATSPSDGQVRTTTLLVNGASTLTGSSTITKSFDGFVIGGTFEISTSTLDQTLYTNNFDDMYCDGDSSVFYIKNNGSFAPSLNFSVGTSTGTVATANLLATTTVATSTPGTASAVMKPGLESNFMLANGESIIGIVGTYSIAPQASSTNFGNWTAEYAIQCWLINI